MKRAWKIALAGILIAAAGMFFPAWAAEPIARTSYGASSVTWSPNVENEGFVLTVLGPERYSYQQTFKSGETPAFEAVDAKGNQLPDGSYSWELRAVPVVSSDVRERLNKARAVDGRGDEVELELWRAGQIPREDLVLSGSFRISRGSIVPEGLEEAKARQQRPGQKAGATSGSGLTPTTEAVQVIPDDLIVQRSLCVGFDCTSTENFGFDTIRLKENNTRIKFEDTSTGTFPSTDWQLTANDSASGGQNKFSIEDITGARVPFTIEGGSTTNSIYVDSTGRVGFRTSTPVLDLHIATSNTPGIRLEQNNSGGFTAQTWDIAGNEANFFVRDVTSGSRLPFRIRPGAPTSSIDIAADGDVGIGTASPQAKLHVASGEVRFPGGSASTNGFNSHINFNGENFLRGNTILADDGGNVGIGCNSPGADLVIGGGVNATCATPPFSSITAGATSFTSSSSRTYKKNLSPIQVPDILEKITGVGVYTYDFISGPTDRLGLMAEDFHQIFGRGSDKVIDGGEVEMALWLAVQQLAARNQQLVERLGALETQVATTQEMAVRNQQLLERLEALEARLASNPENTTTRANTTVQVKTTVPTSR